MEPSFPRANYLLAVNYRKSGLLSLAANHYKMELDINPESAEVHNDLGIVLFQLGDTKEGLSHLQKALKAVPDNSIYQSNLNKALEQVSTE